MAGLRTLAHLSAEGFRFLGTDRDLNRLAQKFSEQNFLRFPGFLAGPLTHVISSRLETTEFRFLPNPVGSDESAFQSTLPRQLGFLLWDPAFVAFLRKVTGSGEIRDLMARVYRLSPGTCDELDWHSDTHDPKRLIGFSLNLVGKKYQGGRFQIQNLGKEKPIEVPNLGPGDLLIFRIAHHLVHRVTPVTGKVPKVTFAGWFRG